MLNETGTVERVCDKEQKLYEQFRFLGIVVEEL